VRYTLDIRSPFLFDLWEKYVRNSAVLSTKSNWRLIG